MPETSILYIEDNPENRLLVRRTLEASGYGLTEAVDGPSGLRAARESRPDLILLDISLPEMDGYDLAQRFAGFPHLERVPVIAMTANVMKGDKERALNAGCDGYIPKPIDIDQLPRQVEEALQAACGGPSGPDAGVDESPIESDPGADGSEGQPEPVGGLPTSSSISTAPAPQRTPLEHRGEVSGTAAVPSAGSAPGKGGPERVIVSQSEPPSRRPGQESEGAERDVPSATETLALPAQPEVGPVGASVRGGREQEAQDGAPVRTVAADVSAPSKDLIVDEMNRLADELGATAVVLARGAQVVADVGGPDEWQAEEMAALAAQGLEASQSAASLFGCEGACVEQITDSGKLLLHTVSVDGDLVLVAAMPTSVPLGAARLWGRRAARHVDRIFRGEA